MAVTALAQPAQETVLRAVSRSANWWRHTGESMLHPLGECLTEKRRQIPAASAVSTYLIEVDSLYQDVAECPGTQLRRLEQALDRGVAR